MHRALVLFPVMSIGRRPTPPVIRSRKLCALVATSHDETFLIKHERVSFRSGRDTLCALPTEAHVILPTVRCRAAWDDDDDGDDAEFRAGGCSNKKKASNRLPRG